MTENLNDAITIVSKRANDHIVNPPPNRRNPGEWSKREECWEAFREKSIQIPRGLERELVDTRRPTDGRYAPSSSGVVVIHDAEVTREITRVMEVPAETWFQISRWAKETDNLLP